MLVKNAQHIRPDDDQLSATTTTAREQQPNEQPTQQQPNQQPREPRIMCHVRCQRRRRCVLCLVCLSGCLHLGHVKCLLWKATKLRAHTDAATHGHWEKKWGTSLILVIIIVFNKIYTSKIFLKINSLLIEYERKYILNLTYDNLKAISG